MRGWQLVGICALAACGFSAPQAIGDGGTDGPRPDAPDGALCYGELERICLATLPTAPFGVNGGMTAPINTDSSAFCRAPAPGSSVTAACVIAATNIIINGTLRATGSRPLVLVSTGAITINSPGLIDASSRGFAEPGGGARDTCGSGTPPQDTGGGAGGTFGGAGGGGGTGSRGSAGGSAAVATGLAGLVGGCPGVAGGTANSANQGVGGFGGGAIDLIAVTSVTVSGRINASGGGGNGGKNRSAGGGGGGSGGLIVLDAPGVTIDGRGQLFAQGGGGGEGAGDFGGGARGDDPPSPGNPAGGGNGQEPGGGDGGDGAVSAGGAAGLGDNDSGGGGGGGAGHIRCTTASPTMGGDAFPPMQCP